MKVVIIDDDKSSGKALADLLETKYDMEVLGCALCGLDGLAMVNRYQPDVLFLDIQLPDVNGLISWISCRDSYTAAARW